MKHIKFEFAEPLVAIQRVRNEVFLGDDNALWCSSKGLKQQIEYLLKTEGIPVRKLRQKAGEVFYKIHLGFLHYFVPNIETDEIIVMKGQDRVWVENEFGEDVTPPSDLDIDKEPIS